MIRPARPADGPAIHRLIRELAAYERSGDQVTGSQEQLAAALFGEHPAVFAHVAEVGGQVAGFALWFLNFSTWLASHGIYLEDLYVTPALRGTGLGRALLAELARICVQRGTGGWSGGCWTGTPPPSASTPRSAPGRWTSGPCTG